MPEILGMGAEAIIKRNKDIVIKHRMKKGYRIKQIDIPLRKQRTRMESRLMRKALELVPCPRIIETKKFTIKMEFVGGKLLKKVLDNADNKKIKKICKQLGEHINSLHKYNIIHGDLTTSNLIYKNEKVYFIDFGLGFISPKQEDKAVDLFLLKRAFNSRHPEIAKKCFGWVLSEYKDKTVVGRLELVESRGRYKSR